MSGQGVVFPQVLQGGDRSQIPRETGVGWPENPSGVTRDSTLDRGTLSVLDGAIWGRTSQSPIPRAPADNLMTPEAYNVDGATSQLFTLRS